MPAISKSEKKLKQVQRHAHLFAIHTGGSPADSCLLAMHCRKQHRMSWWACRQH
jgi:hypothetical protein